VLLLALNRLGLLHLAVVAALDVVRVLAWVEESLDHYC